MNSFAADGHDPEVKIRMRGLSEIADTDWISLTDGITVLTGRNNVGKTRILQAIADLAPPTETDGFTPQARIETADAAIEIAVGPGAVFEQYQVTGSDGTINSVEWEHIPQNPMSFGLRLSTGGTVVYQSRPTWFSMQGSLPLAEVAAEQLQRLVYVPAMRAIPGIVDAIRLEIPGPSGSDLGRAIYTRRNDGTVEFDELQEVMAGMFPEIGAILTQPARTGLQQVQITYKDKFAGRNTPLDQSGTGVAQALHLVALALFSEPGRILLVDEPHAFLHPGAERRLVQFLRNHPEHSYVCATHSPVFISAADPEACYLVTRDEAGTAVRSVFSEGLTRRRVFAELGISAGEVALAEHVLFVEGPSDKSAYPMLLNRLGFNVIQHNCLVLSLAGADLTRPLSAILTELSSQLQLPFTVLLDGDKQQEYRDNPAVWCLPVANLEELVLQDPAAVRTGLLAAVAESAADEAEVGRAEWTLAAVEKYLTDKRRPETKALQLLTGLARQMGVTYSKAVHTPMIAQHLRQAVVDQLKPVVSRITGV